MNFKLSPSDLTFGYEGCKRCFYLKVVNGISQPSIPLPSIFTQIATLLKNHYDGKHTQSLHAKIPPGAVILGEKWVKSSVIELPNHKDTCYISGRFDIVVSFDDGSYGVIDFKTGSPSKESANHYKRQLQAYAYALEHPAPRALALSPISKLGLLYFYPSRIHQSNVKRLSYSADITWVEVKKDEDDFRQFLDKVLGVLELPEVPEHSPTCQWCYYVNRLNMPSD
jgi:CRISPR/Cas system-associated exonuclease Cas4 (RecB family)